MGISANQARLMTLTARKHDLELRAQQISSTKLIYSMQSEQVALDYSNALNNNTTNVGTNTYSTQAANTSAIATFAATPVAVSSQSLVLNTDMVSFSSGTQKNLMSSISDADALTYAKASINCGSSDETLHNLNSGNFTQKDMSLVKSRMINEMATIANNTSASNATYTKGITFDNGYTWNGGNLSSLKGDLTVIPAGTTISSDSVIAGRTTSDLINAGLVTDTSNTITIGGNNTVGPTLSGNTGSISFEDKVNSGLIERIDLSDNIIGVADRWNGSSNSSSSTSGDQTIEQAKAKYDAATAELSRKEKMLDLELTQINTEHEAINTEYDSVKSLIGDNVDKSFNLFG